MTSFSRMPPKYSCTICGKMFRRNKQHYNHVMRNTCGKKRIATAQGITKTLTEIQQEYQVPYIGREYQFNPIATGMRHLRSGLPLPRISKYRRAAI